MENTTQNKMNLHADTQDLIGKNVINRTTQTIRGDSLFINELKDQEFKKESQNIQELQWLI